MNRTQEGKRLIAEQLDELKTVRDEIRLELHLAGMELRDEWQRIERELPDPSRAAEQLKEAATQGLERVLSELRGFQARLRQKE
jgi:hypothetical protein